MFGTVTAIKHRNIIVTMLGDASIDKAILGKDKEDYAIDIMNDKFWGGAIELSLFSKYYQLVVKSIDTATLRVDSYGLEDKFTSCVYLLYNGIHYDPLAMQINPMYDNSLDITIFASNDMKIQKAMVDYVGSFTDTYQNLDMMQRSVLKCDQCNKIMIGEQEAVNHLTKTGHDKFSEN